MSDAVFRHDDIDRYNPTITSRSSRKTLACFRRGTGAADPAIAWRLGATP